MLLNGDAQGARMRGNKDLVGLMMLRRVNWEGATST
jgi:hypothetical protein